jgi:hypothetical protein
MWAFLLYLWARLVREWLMPVKDAKDWENQFETLLKEAERAPVRIQKDGVDVAVSLPPEHFRALTRPPSRT